MGFIYAIPEKAYGMLNDIWDDVVVGSSLTENPKDGTRFALGEKQMLLLLSEDKIVDYATVPGGYIYHSAVEAGMDKEDMAEKFPDSFTEKASENVKVQIMDMNQASGGYFSFANVPFHDSEYDIDITIQGTGTYTLAIAEPLFYYLKSKEKQETESVAMDEQFIKALTPAIVEMGNVGIRYDQLAYVAGRMLPVINEQLGNVWKEQRGVELAGLAFSSIMPDDASFEKIIQAKKAKAEAEARERALREAAAGAARREEEARKAAEAAQKEAEARRAAEEAQRMASQAAYTATNMSGSGVGENWVCTCGMTNTGKFCPQCGTKKPEMKKEEMNRFCPGCGFSLSDRGPNLKFCPQCGMVINSDNESGVTHASAESVQTPINPMPGMNHVSYIVPEGKKVFMRSDVSFGFKKGVLLLKKDELVFKESKGKETSYAFELIENVGIAEKSGNLEFSYWGEKSGKLSFACKDSGLWVNAIIRAQKGSYPKAINVPMNQIEASVCQNFTLDMKVQAVKYYRDNTGAGLAEAHAVVERLLI